MTGDTIVTAAHLIESDESGFTVAWETNGAGSGTITIYVEAGSEPFPVYRCANSGLSRSFVRMVLIRFLDNVEFDEDEIIDEIGCGGDFSIN